MQTAVLTLHSSGFADKPQQIKFVAPAAVSLLQGKEPEPGEGKKFNVPSEEGFRCIGAAHDLVSPLARQRAAHICWEA